LLNSNAALIECLLLSERFRAAANDKGRSLCPRYQGVQHEVSRYWNIASVRGSGGTYGDRRLGSMGNISATGQATVKSAAIVVAERAIGRELGSKKLKLVTPEHGR
jgi:hypothetical protein